jgi:ligand-binding SRPBCC domain-containing protein
MTSIKLYTEIKAPIRTVFDLSRDIDVHLETMEYSNEKAIAGRTSGCIELGETVTWQGKHFGMNIQHQSIITAMEIPTYFVDEMKNGHFKWLKHEHFFESKNRHTIMTDHFSYEVPFGAVGRILNSLFLKPHLLNILEKRSKCIKKIAETPIL